MLPTGSPVDCSCLPLACRAAERLPAKAERHLRFVDGLRIDGEVHGDVLASGGNRSLLGAGENARVAGKVKASHMVIDGEITAPVRAAELLELQPRARIFERCALRSARDAPGCAGGG